MAGTTNADMTQIIAMTTNNSMSENALAARIVEWEKLGNMGWIKEQTCGSG